MSVSIRSALAESAETLAANAVAEPRLEASSLLAHTTSRDRAFLITHGDEVLTPEQLENFRSLVARRAAGEPLQYITGHQEFFKLDFEVNPDVLIPRPETEIIVEAALELWRREDEAFIADIGTGSGCIVISLLHELPAARAVGADASPAALRLAKRNAERYAVKDRLKLLESDCFSALDGAGKFDLIVSNPPYVSDGELETIQREVRREPRSALAGGPDGLDVIRILLRDAPSFLRPRSHLVFEVGFGQDSIVEKLIDRGTWDLIEIRRDLQGVPRTVILQKR